MAEWTFFAGMLTMLAAISGLILFLDRKQDRRIAERFTQQDQRIVERFAQQDQRIAERFAQVDMRFDQVDMRMDRMDARMDRMDARFDRMEERMERFESNLRAMWRTVERMQGMLDILVYGSRDLPPPVARAREEARMEYPVEADD